MKLETLTAALAATLLCGAGAVEDGVAPAPLVQGHVRAVALDAAGNRFVAGFFFGEVDFHPGVGLDAHTSAGDADLFLTRFNADGSYAWTRTFGGSGEDAATAVAVSKTTVFVGGFFASADAGVANAGGADAVALAFDATSGEPRAAFGNAGVQTFGGAGNDSASGIAAAGKTLYICGAFASANTKVGGAGPIFSSAGEEDAFVLALDAASGRRRAAFGRRGVQTLAGLSTEHATGLALSGRALFVGGYLAADSTGIGKPGATVGFGGLDAFVLALDRITGRARKMFGTRGLQLVGGTGNDLSLGLAAGSGGVYLAGTFASPDAGIGAPGAALSAGGFDAFVAALNPKTGAAHPAFGVGGVQSFGGSEDDAASAVAIAGDRLHLAGGFTSQNAGIGGFGAMASGGGGDAFALQLDAFTGGTFDFAPTTFGGSADDAAFALAATGGSVFIGGSAFSPDAGPGGAGALDATGWNGFVFSQEPAANDIASLTAFDTDGDGFPDETEAALGTPPAEFIVSPAGFDAGPAAALTVRSLALTLHFTTPDPSRDSLTLRGRVPIPAGFSSAGQQVAVSVGGVVRRFVLNARGVGATGGSSFVLKVKKTRGRVPAQEASFTAIFKRSSMRAQLDDEALTGDATIGEPGADREVAALVAIGGGFARAEVALRYTVIAGQSGAASTP